MVDILLKLPVKSVSRFKCVSKSWLYLISSHKFIKSHTRVSTEKLMLNGHGGVIFTIFDSPSNLMQCSLSSLLREQPLTDALNLDYPTNHPPEHVWIVGSCDGLVCIAVDKGDLILWNPTTRKSRKVPPAGPELRVSHYGVYGFFFDESDDDYKVVGTFGLKTMLIYGLRNDSWKSLGCLDDGIPLGRSIKLASGKLHWLATLDDIWPWDHGERWDLARLDLESGDYEVMEQPGGYVLSDLECSLGLIGGRICILRFNLCHYISLWIWEEYGVKESWNNVFMYAFTDYADRIFLMKPLCLLPNGEILLVCAHSFYICNPTNDSLRVVKAPNLRGYLEADMFVESLVSPVKNA